MLTIPVNSMYKKNKNIIISILIILNLLPFKKTINAPTIMVGEKASDHILAKTPLSRLNFVPE